MNCRDFLDRHTEYVDGVIDSPTAVRMSEHARSCPSCARYDRVVRRSGELVRDLLPAIGVSTDFGPRMRHRLYHERDDLARRRAGSASVFAAAASFVLLVAGAGAVALVAEGTPVVNAQIVWAETPRPYTPLRSHAVAVPLAPSLPGATLKDAAPATPIQAEARGHDAHVASPAAWPVYSSGAVAVAFPASRPAIVVSPADFRRSVARPVAGPILIRH